MTSNITFTGDYDALITANELEVKRAMIYNYLINIDMPLISDIILIEGSYEEKCDMNVYRCFLLQEA